MNVLYEIRSLLVQHAYCAGDVQLLVVVQYVGEQVGSQRRAAAAGSLPTAVPRGARAAHQRTALRLPRQTEGFDL